MPVSLFGNKPEHWPFGHQLWPGKAQVSWKPCICAPAREAAARGRGMGHAIITCASCHDQLRQTTFYEPAHDSGHDPLTGWVMAAGPGPERVGDDGQRDRDPEAAATLTTQMIPSGVCA